MPDDPVETVARPRGSQIKNVLLEAVLVAVAGAVFAFVANQISPRGLKLTRDYFPGSKTASVAVSAGANAGSRPRGESNAPGSAADSSTSAADARATRNTQHATTNAPTDAELLAQRLRDNGLHLIELAQVRQLAQDPRARQGLILFVDARNTESYESGHIPGACEFDPYRPEKYAASVIPLCQAAQQIIVYCNGGECEDSQFAAITLRDAGISGDKLFVYAGGITEWKDRGLPMEKGGQNADTKP